ncbi:hypothetical protein N9F31_02895 [Pseudomonadales bacterium]|nr:hypothetical protein [Pseudomonadales bacterium]
MHQDERLRYLVIGNAMVVLLIGLVAGVMLIFSLLDAVTLWPLPEWKVVIPGSTRGWQAAHVGGILNGVMIAGAAYLMQTLALSGRREQWAGWGMIITGWANTVFYWAGNFAANRGLSVSTTPYGEGDLAGALAFLGGGAGMIFTFIAVSIFALSAFEQAKIKQS